MGKGQNTLTWVLFGVVAGLLIIAVAIPAAKELFSKAGDSAKAIEDCKFRCVGPDPVQLIVISEKTRFSAESVGGEPAKDPLLGTSWFNELEFLICNCRGSKIASLKNALINFNLSFSCSQSKYGDGEKVVTYEPPGDVKNVRNLAAGQGVSVKYGQLIVRIEGQPTKVYVPDAADYRLDMTLPRNDFTGSWKAELIIDNQVAGTTGGAVEYTNKDVPGEVCAEGLPA